MKVRWTTTALRDIESLHQYIAQDRPDAAAATLETICSGIEALERHLEMGRKGRANGTQEVIIPPYVVVYRVHEAVIELLAIIHSARRWPDSF